MLNLIQTRMKKPLFLLMLASCLLTALALAPGTSAAHAQVATWTGVTINWANVRSGPSTSFKTVATDAPNTNVTVSASVHGGSVSGNSTWYRVSSSSQRYIWSGLVVHSSNSGPTGGGPAPSARGKVIVVYAENNKQVLYAYQDSKLVKSILVTTGRPELFTPTGTYHVFRKLHPTTFYSPWPPGSPYYYPPTFINYALEFDGRGLFLHDATWRSQFGPGKNTWHTDPVFGRMTGSHGCVTMSLKNAAWIYGWAPIGTEVIVK